MSAFERTLKQHIVSYRIHNTGKIRISFYLSSPATSLQIVTLTLCSTDVRWSVALTLWMTTACVCVCVCVVRHIRSRVDRCAGISNAPDSRHLPFTSLPFLSRPSTPLSIHRRQLWWGAASRVLPVLFLFTVFSCLKKSFCVFSGCICVYDCMCVYWTVCPAAIMA